MKYILLALLSICPLLAKQAPQDVELMAKINQLEAIEKEIDAKVKFIDGLYDQGGEIRNCISYGYDKEQREVIWIEANKLEQYISQAIYNNSDISKAIRTPLCPHLTLHRNELDRMQQISVQACMAYFCLRILWQRYLDISEEICKIQFAINKSLK